MKIKAPITAKEILKEGGKWLEVTRYWISRKKCYERPLAAIEIEEIVAEAVAAAINEKELKETQERLQIVNKLDKLLDLCNVCGGSLISIRGKYPQRFKEASNRVVCPTCIVEQLEDILAKINNYTAKVPSTKENK